MSIRVLLIDDDARLRELLGTYLAQNDVTLEYAANGPQGLEQLARRSYDCVLLDVMMPGMDGLTVLRRIRADGPIPVLMLTAKGDEADRVTGLEMGADDYVAKPFSSRELLARLRAVLRRAQPGVTAERLGSHDVDVEVDTRRCHVEGQPVELTGLEFDLLVALMRRAGRVIPRQALLEQAGRGDVAVGERTIDVHVSKLRKKIGGHRIKTVRGVGYVFSRGER
ncbi:MAG: response regulator transcription factor [Myxococcales bacterium FL481]|nr:MAG: response regulator transcription factor [Myxococcales bacterium FL481]